MLIERCTIHCGTAAPGWPLGQMVHCGDCHDREPGRDLCYRDEVDRDPYYHDDLEDDRG